MARAKQPVSVNGIEFDALISEDHILESDIPQYVTESGFSVSDAIIQKPETLDMVLMVTDTPVTWYSRHGKGRTVNVIRQLESLYFSSTPVTVITSEKTYTNMGIESLKICKSEETGYSREIPITFKKIRVTSSRTGGVPASYGKSGTTGASAGTANTSNQTTGSQDSGSSDSSSGSQKTSSILYGIGKAIGNAVK